MGKIKSWLKSVFKKQIPVPSVKPVIKPPSEGLKTVRLIRDIETEDGTFGTLHLDGKLLCQTLEDRWVNNTPRVSCIPKGRYLCVSYSSAKFPDVWEITNVPGRTKILTHAGNTHLDTSGCVIVGTAVGKIGDTYGVVGSQAAMVKLRATLPPKFWIEIT